MCSTPGPILCPSSTTAAEIERQRLRAGRREGMRLGGGRESGPGGYGTTGGNAGCRDLAVSI